MSDIRDMSIEMKREAHGNSNRIKEFEPLGQELRRLHVSNSSLRETMVPGSTLSKVLPSVFLKKIEVDNNPDSSAFLDDSSANPHISKLQVVGTNSDGSLIVQRAPVTIGGQNNFDAPPSEGNLTVTVSLNIKQLFDDDDLVYDIIKTLGIDKYLKVKIFAVIDNDAQARRVASDLRRTPRPDLLNTDPVRGIYVIGGLSGISIPQDHSKNNSAISNDFEMSVDGSLVKNTLIKKSFVLSKAPEDMKVFSIAYYDIFESSDFDKEMEANLGALLDDANLSKILIGELKSEIVFQSGELLSEAAVFVENPPSMGDLGNPYMGPVLEVREGLFAKPNRTQPHRSYGGHSHHYYVDKQGNGWTNVHTDASGRQHIHMISSFRLSPSGRFDDLEDTFRAHSNPHSHNLPIAASNSLYKKMVPIDYIVDNRSKGSIGNLKVSLDKEIEDTFSFLKKARRRSNNIKPVNTSTELSTITTRESNKKYISPAFYSSDVFGNCRFTFAIDEASWLSDNTAFGKYIGIKALISKYAEISTLKVFRKKISHYEYEGLKSYKRLNLDSGEKNPEALICTGTTSSRANSGVTGYNQNANIVEYTPAGSQKSQKRRARYFMVVDNSYTISSSSVSTSRTNRGRVDNEPAQLSSGIYSYSVEMSIVDNTVEYFAEALRGLYTVIKKLEDYVLIGSRSENHTGVTREFTKSFRTRVMDDLCREIVNDSMRLLRRVFVDNSSNTILTSDVGFSQRANKIYKTIRPKSGSLYGAERFLKELRGTISYLRGITRIDEVGKYGAQKRGTATNASASGRFSSPSNSRLRKVKFCFKECFHRSKYLDGANSYLMKLEAPTRGLSRISGTALQDAISNSRFAESSYVRLEPQMLVSKETRFRPRVVNERLIRSMYYGRSHSGLLPQAPVGTNTFQIVENSELLREKVATSRLEALSVKNIFGTTDLDDQIISLQESGYLSKTRTTTSDVREAKSLVSGQELMDTLQTYKKANARVVQYFSGFRRVKNSFVPVFALLTKSKLGALMAERRPVLCKISNRISQHSELESYAKFETLDQFFLVADSQTNMYSPTFPAELATLENYMSTYDAEILTTDPDVMSVDDIDNSSSSVLNMGTFGGSSSGGGGY